MVGKLVVVTGGARGLGLAICESLAACGARVVVAARDRAAAMAAAATLPTVGGPAVGLQVDTSSWEGCTDLFEQIAAIGTVEALVNNAGIDVVGPAVELGHPGRVEEVSAAVAFLASEASSCVTGSVLPV